MRPTAPEVVRKAMSGSPSSMTRKGGQSGAGSSSERTAGIQYWRMRLPITVPGPIRHMTSLSSMLSIQRPPTSRRNQRGNYAPSSLTMGMIGTLVRGGTRMPLRNLEKAFLDDLEQIEDNARWYRSGRNS